ncbi:TRAP transporter small permease [Allostella humosa]|nr:TRAP transporter small permease [Stella humosa]
MLSRTIQRLALGLGILSGFGTVVMMLLIVADVAGRTFFNVSLPGSSELAELLLVAMIFLGLAAAQQRREHFNIELATQYLPPLVKQVVALAGWVISLAVVGLLAWLSSKQAWTAFLRDEASYGIIAFPIWPARMLIAFGLALLAVQILLDIAGTLRPRPAAGDLAPQTSRHE